jgi:hypothetical protein
VWDAKGTLTILGLLSSFSLEQGLEPVAGRLAAEDGDDLLEDDPDAVGWIAALDFGRVAGGTVREALNVMNVTPGNAPLGSYAWRRAEHLAAARKGRMKSRW